MKKINQTNIEEAAKILQNGGLIAFPTETVFGLGVVFDDKKAYDRLILVKKRPPDKPFTLMLSDRSEIAKYAEISREIEAIINNFMPGQITLVLKAKPGLPEWCVAKDGTIGVRVPDYDAIRELIRLTGKPLLVPSANKSGEPPANSLSEVVGIFNNEIDAVIDGSSISHLPSTVVIIKEKSITIAREGAIKKDDIEKVINEVK